MDKTATHDTIWTVDDALAFLRGESERGTLEWEQLCLRLACRAYGYAFSNVVDVDADHDNDVADYWARVKPEHKHEGDRTPPIGGLAIFGNPGRFGHVAVVVRSDGRGVVVLANDDLADGRVRPLSVSSIEKSLHLEYLGWAEPHFPLATPGNPRGLPAGDTTPSVFLRALFPGNSDSDSIRMLQRRLGQVLGTDLAVTGTYDAPTRQAVQTFQARCCRFVGAGADGLMWDPATQSGGERTAELLFPARTFAVRLGAVADVDHHIVDAPESHTQPDNAGLTLPAGRGVPVPDTDEPSGEHPRVDLAQLVPGRTNRSVRRLQQRLNRVNEAGLTVTGTYDEATVAAVRAWQLVIGDEDAADGVLGPLQFARLFPRRHFARAGAPPPDLDLSDRGEDFIVEFEGFSSELYNDQAGHCTIGVGHLVHLGHCDAHEGGLENGITRARAMAMLRADARATIDTVASNVSVPLTQAQFDALVSFTFNVGDGNFLTSTLLQKLNASDFDAVPAQLVRWNKVTVNGHKVASNGLTRRRGREATLFATGVYTA